MPKTRTYIDVNELVLAIREDENHLDETSDRALSVGDLATLRDLCVEYRHSQPAYRVVTKRYLSGLIAKLEVMIEATQRV